MSAIPSRAQSKPYEGLLPVVASVDVVDPADLKNDWFASGWSWLGMLARLAFSRYQIGFFIGIAATLAWQAYGDAARERIAHSYPQLGWLAPQPAPTAPSAPDLVAQVVPAAGSPDQQQVKPMSLDVDGVRQTANRIAASQQQITLGVDQLTAGQEQMRRSIDRIAASQQQIALGVDQLTAGQEQITRSIDRIAASQEQITRSIDRIAASQEPIAHGIDQLTASQDQMTREIAKLQETGKSVVYRNSEPPPRPAVALARNPVPGSSQQAVPLDRKPTEAGAPQALPEGGKQPLAASGHDSTCFPSASAVLQNHPGALPSWTLRAPGHEGTRCWYAARQP